MVIYDDLLLDDEVYQLPSSVCGLGLYYKYNMFLKYYFFFLCLSLEFYNAYCDNSINSMQIYIFSPRLMSFQAGESQRLDGLVVKVKTAPSCGLFWT